MTAPSQARARRLIAKALAGLACGLLCTPALAALGGSQTSVDDDARALHAVAGSAQNTTLTVRTLSLPTGTLVKEYLTTSGTVAAISWRGPRPPNLSQLLGDYYADYQTALAARPAGEHNHHLQLSSSRMVLESGGHMRDLHGSAYLPALLPQNFTAGDAN